MLFKYWIEFDGDGEIKELHKSKDECKSTCKEYIVKLIPIDRQQKNLSDSIDKTVKSAKEAAKSIKRLDTEINRTVKDLRRIRI